MTILLTGANGFIGRHVLSQLLEAGHHVLAVVRPSRENQLAQHPKLIILPRELRDICMRDIEGCEMLIHLAAYGVGQGMNDWENCFQINVHDSLNLWRQAALSGTRRFIICGSCFEYGRSAERYEFIPVTAPLEPTGAYHASKAAATMAALGLAVDQGLELVVARPFHVFGEGETPTRFWPSLRRAALAGEDFPMTNGEQIRDFTDVETVAKELVYLATIAEIKAGYPKIENIGSGKPQSILDFAKEQWAALNAKGKLKPGAIAQRNNETMRYVPFIKIYQ